MNDLMTEAEFATDLAGLFVDYWKLARGSARAADLLQEADSKRLLSQVKYATRQLNEYAERYGFRIVEFDGLAFEPGMAASADNADDFEDEELLVVTRTIEPAIVYDMRVIRTGRVVVAHKNS